MATEQELAQALGPAFGIYPKAFRGNYGNPEDSANLPVDVTRGRTASFLGFGSDLLNMFQSPKPMEVFGDVQYEPKIKVPYDTEHFLKTLPLAPTSRAGQVAGQAASFVPLNPAPLVRAGVAGAKALAPTAARMTEGYLQRQGLMPGVMPEQPSLLGNMTTKPKAEVSPLGFYSAVEQQALNIPRKQGSGESFLNDLAKGQDVKKYEMETMGLDEFLRGKPNVTRQEVQDFIAGNRIDVQERQLSGRGDKSGVFSEFNPDKNQFMVYGEDLSHTHAFNTAEEADNFVKQFNSQIPYGPSKYDKYQLPGGENYREILLTLPFKEPAMPKGYQVTSMQYDDGTVKYFAETPTSRSQGFRTQEEAQAQLSKTASNLKGFRENLDSYRSTHFDEPNILAHMRVNDRIDADGKKMLLIEEVQSDWHQAGREKGYQSADSAKAMQAFDNYSNELATKYDLNPAQNLSMYGTLKGIKPEEIAKYDSLQSAYIKATSGVPDAPFKDTWHQLALKRALKEAVDKGYDRIGLTTGAQQAERYNLAKQVDEVIAKRNPDGSFNLDATLVGGGTQQSIGKNIASDKLADYVGKDLAKTMQSQTAGTDVYSGDALKVGGEGMKKYYDEIYPAFLNKQGKKYGAQVGETRIKTGRGVPGGEPVRYLDITPEMRKAIKEGQPIASIQNELAKALA